jgi:putative transposase
MAERTRNKKAGNGESQQLSLARTAGHGGLRAGAGRKKQKTTTTGARRDVAHVARAKLARHAPVHVTLRAAAGRPSLRTAVVRAMFVALVRELNGEAFQVVVFSIQRDHVHLICEAIDVDALTTAMRRFTIRSALRLNALFGRASGNQWDGGYHRHDLRTPREVRHALVYVLMNWKKHGEARSDEVAIDPYSSGSELDGWEDGRTAVREACGAPRFWLLAKGWRRLGLLSPAEAPRTAR